MGNTSQARKIYFINLLPIILISLNLRAPITSVGPIVDVMQTHYGLSAAQAGLLTSLPLLAFGLVSFIVAIFQPIRAMFFGLICVAMGEVIRAFGESIELFIGTAIMGAGIAVANVLLPSFIKAKFPREIPKIMGIYSLVLNLSAALGIAAILPLTHLLPLPLALSCWVLLAILALISYLPQVKNRRFARPKAIHIKGKSLFSNIHAWKITFFMGAVSSMAYSFFAWYPSFVIGFGYDRVFASHMMLIAQVVMVPFSLIVPLLLGSLAQKSRNIFVIIICMLYALSFALLLLSQALWCIVFVSFIIGIPVGGAFGVALLFISNKSANVRVATKLSAMAQGVGYLMASACPVLIGKIYDIFGDFTYALLFLVGLGLVINVLGFLAQRVKSVS